MKPFYRSLLLLSLLIAAACSTRADSADTSANPSGDGVPILSAPDNTTNVQIALPVNADGVQIVARVNGTEITLQDLERAVFRRSLEVEAADSSTLQASALDILIEQVLIAQIASAQQIAVDDQTLAAEYQYYVENADDFGAWLQQNGYTDPEFREALRVQLITHQMRDVITAGIPEDVPQVHARHILVNTQGEANAILQRLQNGEDFAVLAAEVSNDITTNTQGGDLGWFAEGELFEPLLASTAFALTPGQTAGPVGTRLGFHVIQTLETGQRPLTPGRRATVSEFTFENWLQSQMQNATVERFM